MAVDVLGSGVDVPSRKLAGLGKGVCDPPWFKRRNERRRRASGVSNRRVRGLVGKSPNTLHRSLAMELRRQRASPSGCRWSTPALPYREGTTDTGRVATRSASASWQQDYPRRFTPRPAPSIGRRATASRRAAPVRMRDRALRLSSRPKRSAEPGPIARARRWLNGSRIALRASGMTGRGSPHPEQARRAARRRTRAFSPADQTT